MIGRYQDMKAFMKGLGIRYIWRWITLGALIGIVSGFGAVLFDKLLHLSSDLFLRQLAHYTPPTTASELLTFLQTVPLTQWMLFIVPAVGGLISGILVYSVAPEAEGHGTDAMIEAIHRKRGIIRKRVPLVKIIASAITIGSGGSAGKEGPTAQIGSGFGSYLASLLRLSDRDRRVMVLAGAAGGLGAIFKAPLGSALFAVEVLYKEPEFEYDGILPCILSSIVGYSVFVFYSGAGTLFHTPRIQFTNPLELLFYAVFGVACAAVGVFYIQVFYGLRDRFFRKIPIDDRFKPAVGGLLLGALAFCFPQVLGGGYEWIQLGIEGKMAMGLLLLVAFAKILATGFTISSGGSGGVFAPSLFIGAMLGGAFGQLFGKLFPQIVTNPSAFVLVGMGGFFAGVAKVPIASLIMVAEMTGSYTLLVPMMLVSTLTYLFTGRFSIYESQVLTRLDSPAHIGEFAIDILDHISVGDVIARSRKADLIPETMPFREMVRFIADSGNSYFPVVNSKGEMTGILSLTDIRGVAFEDALSDVVIAKDIATGNVRTMTASDNLSQAIKEMTSANVSQLPVVDPKNRKKVLAMLSRHDIVLAYYEQMEKLHPA
jgi:CIC family chloride channel protein